MSTRREPGWLPDVALTALLRAVLQDGAKDPFTLLAGDARGSTVVRIGRGRAAEDERQFDELLLEAFDSTGDMLLAFVTRQVGSRVDAEDIVQTAFMRVYAAKPDLTDADQLRAYLWTATKNLVRDSWRRAAIDRAKLEPDGDERVAVLADRAGLDFDDVVVLRQTLIAVLDTLPRREREAVVLRAYEGNTYAETARIMGLSAGTVKGYVHDALARVRERLDSVA